MHICVTYIYAIMLYVTIRLHISDVDTICKTKVNNMSNKTIALLLAALMVTVAGIGIVSAETNQQYTAGEWYNYMSEHMANFMGRGTGYGMMGGSGGGYAMMNGYGPGACLANSGDASTSGTAPELAVKTVDDALVIAKKEINSDVKAENIKPMGRFWVVYYTDGDTIESARIDAFTGEVVDETTGSAQYTGARQGGYGGYGMGSGMGGMMYGR